MNENWCPLHFSLGGDLNLQIVWLGIVTKSYTIENRSLNRSRNGVIYKRSDTRRVLATRERSAKGCCCCSKLQGDNFEYGCKVSFQLDIYKLKSQALLVQIQRTIWKNLDVSTWAQPPEGKMWRLMTRTCTWQLEDWPNPRMLMILLAKLRYFGSSSTWRKFYE